MKQKAALGHNYEDGVCTRCGEHEQDELTLNVENNEFTVTAKGKDEGKDVVIVALYKNDKELLDLRMFDLSKTGKINDTFTNNGKVKAYWWKDFETFTPMCGCVEKMIDEIENELTE